MRLYWNPRNHPKLLSQKSWYLGIQNGPIARGFWNLNQSIEQKVKNLQLEKCRYIKDIKITFWDTAQYFHSKQLIKSVEKIFLLKFVHVWNKRPKKYFQTNIVTCSFMPASLNLQVQLSYSKTIIYLIFKKKKCEFGDFFWWWSLQKGHLNKSPCRCKKNVTKSE